MHLANLFCDDISLEFLQSELQALEEANDDSYEPPTKATPPAIEPARSGGQAPPGVTAELLKSRLVQYIEAQSNAKATGDASKAKRMDRGIKVVQ